MVSIVFKDRVSKIRNKKILLTEAYILARIIKDDIENEETQSLEENIEKLIYILEHVKKFL